SRRPRMKNLALLAALGAVAATAWAMNDSYSPASTTATTTTLAPAEPVVVHETVMTSEPIVTKETVITTETAAVPAPARPVAVADEVRQPPITIEQRRLSLDERIQSDVMDAILHSPNMTGQIGVESHDAAVTLTGWTATGGQARRAERLAHVTGVRYVDNQTRPRVGAI